MNDFGFANINPLYASAIPRLSDWLGYGMSGHRIRGVRESFADTLADTYSTPAPVHLLKRWIDHKGRRSAAFRYPPLVVLVENFQSVLTVKASTSQVALPH